MTAQYILLKDHWLAGPVNGLRQVPTGSTVTEGVDMPLGWVPTLAVDPITADAATAFYNAGLRDLYPGPSNDIDYYELAQFPLRKPVSFWKPIPGTACFQMTGLGAGFPPVCAAGGSTSSAGVFNSSGVLVRTLWSAQTNDLRASNPAAAWDGTLDDGSVAPTGTYTVTLLTHSVTYSWDGVIGNSSPDHSNVSVTGVSILGGGYRVNYYHSYGSQIRGMAITTGGEIYFTTAADERMNTMHVATTANPQYANGILPQVQRGTFSSHNACCTDNTNVYFNDADGTQDFVWALNCSTKTPVVYSAGTPAGSFSCIGYSLTSAGKFVFGIAAKPPGTFLYISRIENPSTPSYSIWSIDLSTGATAHVNLTGYYRQGAICTNPVSGEPWVVKTVNSATTNSTWDPFTNTGGMVLSNSNLTVTNPLVSSPGVFAYSSGTGTKFYYEVVVNAIASTIGFDIGIASDTTSRNGPGFLGFDAASFSFFPFGGYAGNSNEVDHTVPGYGLGDNVSIAVDMVNQHIWMRVNGGNWNGSPTANPATNTGGIFTQTVGTPVYAAINFVSFSGNQGTAHFSSASWTYAAPAGFSQLPGVIHTTSVAKLSDTGGGVLIDTGVAALVGNPLAVAISPDGATLLVVDGDPSHVVRAFNTSDGSVKTAFGNSGVFGTLGGYLSSPAVTKTKFMFFSPMGIAPTDSTLAYDPHDGSFWLGDNGNARWLHFSSGNSPTFIEEINYFALFYSCHVCGNDPTRIFGTYLEFKMDYSKPLAYGNGSWTLTNNWANNFQVPGGFQGFSAMRYASTLSNGRTYCPFGNQIFELTSSGLRDTGVTANFDYIDRDFNLWHIVAATAAGQSAQYFVNHLTGFDISGNPQYTTNPSLTPSVLFLTTTAIPTGFPYILCSGENNAGNYAEVLANGTIPIYYVHNPFTPSPGLAGYRLGGINATTGNVTFMAHHTTIANNYSAAGDVEYPPAPFVPYSNPTAGVAGNSNMTDGAGSFIAYLSGKTDIFTHFHGEQWGSNQVNFWSHWDQSGLLVNRVGTAAPYFGLFSSTVQPQLLTTATVHAVDAAGGPITLVQNNGTYSFMGAGGLAGNVAQGGIALVGSNDYYLYHSDEWYHGGVHRWHVGNLNTKKLTSQTVSWNSGSYVPPTPDPYNFLAALPFDTVNLPNNSGGWVRNPTSDITTGSGGSQDWFRIYTNAHNSDRRDDRDLQFEANIAPGVSGASASATYSWTRVGSGNWTLSAIVRAGAGHEEVTPISNSYFLHYDILDNTGKVIVRMENLFVTDESPGPTGMSFWVNRLGPNAGGAITTPMGNPDTWSAFIQMPQPLSVHFDNGIGQITVSYGGFTKTGVTAFQVGANLALPAQFRIAWNGAPGVGQQLVSCNFTKLRFADV